MQESCAAMQGASHSSCCTATKCLTRLSACTAEDSFNSAVSDGRGSYRSAGSGGDYMSARGSLQPGYGERFGSPRGSYGSGSYASAREFGSRQASAVRVLSCCPSDQCL